MFLTNNAPAKRKLRIEFIEFYSFTVLKIKAILIHPIERNEAQFFKNYQK